MEDTNILNITNNMIFSSIENEASTFFKNGIFSTMKFNDLDFHIETFSNHSYIKSITLFYCFNRIKEHISFKEYPSEIKNIKSYIEYISTYKDYIELENLCGEWGRDVISSFVIKINLLYINDYKTILKHFSDFIFDIMLLAYLKNKDTILSNFLSSLVYSSSNIQYYTNINKCPNDVKEIIFNFNLILYENIFSSIESLKIKKSFLFDGFFQSETIFLDYDDTDNEKSLKSINDKFNREKDFAVKSIHDNSSEILIKKFQKFHKKYLYETYKSIQKINNKNKNKYLENYKNTCNYIAYILISNYLKDVKIYLKTRCKNEY